MAEENPYLLQVAKESGLTKEAVDSENPYLKQAQIESGKPLEIKTNPDKFMSGLEQATSTINVTNRYTDALANYADYDVGLNPFGEDWNEIRAKNQGIGQKIGRGLLKMGTTMSGAFAENTIGLVSGLASMAAGGTYADNVVGRSVDEMNEWMAENLPHYYSQKELDPDRSAFEALGTANFWTDKFANGLGYSLGSLAAVWATGGIGIISRGVGLVGKGIAAVGETASIAKVATTGEKLKKIYEASKMIKTGAKLSDDVAGAAKVARGLNAAKHLEVGGMMSLAESSVEAREKSKQFIRESFEAWEEANPGKSAQQDMTAEERQAILDSARAVENTTFGLNMAILMPTNLFTFGSMIGGSKKLAGISIGENMTEDIIEQGGKYVLKTPNTAFGKTLAKANKFVSPVYKNSLNEAFQEGAQYAIGVGASEYFKNKFDTGSGDFASAFTKGLSETFGSADGMESMLLGALTGGIMGTASTTFGAEAAQRKNVAANTERLLNIKNSAAFTDIMANAEQNDESLRTISAITAANAVGNYKLANELRKQLIATRAAKLQALDAEDLALEEFDDLEKMSEEEFMKRTGYDTTKTEDGKLKATFSEQTGGKSHVQVVQDLKEEFKKAAKLNRDLDDIIQRVNPIKTGLPGMFQSKEQKQADATQRLYNQRLKAIMMQHMVSIDTRDEEINASIDALRKLSPEGPDSFATISKDDILALVKKNKITVLDTGEIQFPKSVVTTSISDTATEEEKAKQKAYNQSPEGQRDKKEEDDDNKIISRLERAARYAETLTPIDKMKFKNEWNNLFSGLQMREESIAAFEELMTSPEKRDLAILAKQGAKAQAKIINDNKDASVVIDEARSTADLETLINSDTLTPELRERLLKKYDELKEIEDQYVDDYNDLPDAALKDILAGIEEISDPQKVIALLRVVADRNGETTAQKEARANASQSKREKDATAAAEAAVSGLKSDANTPNAKAYVNNIRVTTSDNRNIIINGVAYRNNKLNILDAIHRNMEALNDATQPPIISVTLINKDGQTVVFTAEKDPILVNELAEIMMIGYVSQGTADTVDMSKEEATDKAKMILEIYRKNKAALDLALNINPKEATPAVYEYAAKEVQTLLDGLFKAKSLLEEAYKRDNQPESAVKALDEYQQLVSQIETYEAKRDELQRLGREMVGMSSEGDPDAKPEEINHQASVDIDSEVNRLKSKYDSLENKLTLLYDKLKFYQSRSRETLPDGYRYVEPGEVLPAGDYDTKMPLDGNQPITNAPGGNPDIQEAIKEKEKKYFYDPLQENIKDTQKDIDISEVELELIGDAIRQLQEQIQAKNEARESSEAGQNLQDAQGGQGPITEQGNRPEAEGTDAVPESEELDINDDEKEVILSDDVFNSAHLFEDEEGEGDGIIIQSDFQTAADDTSEDIVDEDTVTREPVKQNPEEEGTPASENAGQIDARLVKNEYAVTDDFNNVIVNSEGIPQNNKKFNESSNVKITPSLLTSDKETPVGSEIVFLVTPDAQFKNFNWNEVKDTIPAKDHWKQVPIFVAVRTANKQLRRVGMLEPYNPNKTESNVSREDIYNAYLQGKKVSSTLVGKRGIHNSQNIANAVTANGRRFFYSPFEGGTPTLAIAKAEKESGASKWQIALAGDNLEGKGSYPDINAYPEDMGKVAMIVTTPMGGFKHLMLATKSMTKAGLEAAKVAIKNDNADILKDLIGFNVVAEMAVALDRTDMLFNVVLDRTTKEGEKVRENTYMFYLPRAESYIQISASELKDALNGKSFIYNFKEAVVGEENGIDWRPNEAKKGQQKLFEKDVVKAFEDAVMNRKYQISFNNLVFGLEEGFTSAFGKKYDTYVDYLKDPEAIPDVDVDGDSWPGILGSDMYLNQFKSPYFDIGLTYGPLLIDGKDSSVSEETTSNTSAKAKIEPEEKEEDDEYSNDDDDVTDSTDEELGNNNDLFDALGGEETEETEEEEQPQDETAGSTTTFEKMLEDQDLVSDEVKETQEEEKKSEIPEEDKDLLDPLVSRLNDIKEKEYKGMYVDPNTKEETHYKIQPEGTSAPDNYKRITSFSSEPFNGSEELKISSSTAGNTVHDIVEKILIGDMTYSRGDRMTREAFLDLKSQVSGIKRLIDSRKQTVISTEMIVYNDSYGKFAGKFDILVRDKKSGKYYLYDIKTGSETGLSNYEKGYTDPESKKVSKSKRDQHGTQLSMYAYALRGIGMDKKIKVEITNASVLYIPIRYDKTGHIDRVSGFAEKKFTLNNDIKKLIAGEVSFEIKKAAATSDPSINNAGSSKGSTKSTGPKGQEVSKEGTKVKTGKVTKASLVDDIVNAAEAKGGGLNVGVGSEGKLSNLKKVVERSGGLDNEIFIQMVKDAFDITLTNDEAEKVQNDIIEKIC